MTREEWTNNAAAEYRKRISSDSIRSKAAAYDFAQGIKYADENPKSPWISVKDDLPCNHKDLVHSNYTDRVLVMSRHGYTEVAFMYKMTEDTWEWNNLFVVLYWMPIPEPPEK